MKIIITGVAGFIGSNLAKLLLRQNHTVYGIDNFSYGNHRNILDFEKNKNFVLIYGDLCNPLILKEYCADVIVHLASQKIPRYSSALRTLDENSIMLKNVVQKCLINRSKIVYASTSDVYGKNENIPFNEELDLILGPTKVKRWAYALSKIYGEQYLIANNEEFGLKYSIARFFGSYGINHNLTWWGGPQSGFITKALNKEPLEIHGDGKQTRTFTYIEDTLNALQFLVNEEKADGEIFNIASNPSEEISILGLAQLIWELINGTNSTPNLKFIPYETFGKYEDVRRRVPDITKITSAFNYKPKYTLREGLTKTIEWQKNILKTNV